MQIPNGDLAIYDRVIKFQSPILDALETIPWESFREDLEAFYVQRIGQPALCVILMLKLEYLRYACRLSDRQVIARAQTDLMFRWFLQIPLDYSLPDPSTLCRFRARIGEQGFQQVFDRLIGIARAEGIVRDRLRLKDANDVLANPVLANIAVPMTLRLLAQLRDKMLKVIEPIDPEIAAGYRIEAERQRVATKDEPDDIRLQARLDLVLDMLQWMSQLPEQAPREELAVDWQAMGSVRSLAEKITSDCLNPGRGDRTLSVVDSEA